MVKLEMDPLKKIVANGTLDAGAILIKHPLRASLSSRRLGFGEGFFEAIRGRWQHAAQVG